jgi:uncharacterized protein (TIGR03086 family)
MSSARPPGPCSVHPNPVMDLTPTTSEVARLLAGIRDDQLAGPTPCADIPVAGLLDHLVGLTGAFRLAAEKQPVPGGPRWSAEELPADWRRLLPEQLAGLAAAWRDPAAWDGMAEVVGARMPAAAMGVVAANEVLVHGWDLAVATGQPYSCPDALVEAAYGFVASSAEEYPEGTPGLFGPPVPVAAEAPLLDRLIGKAGRDPGWRPAKAGAAG